MVDPQNAIRSNRPTTIVALFAVAFVLQGMSLAVFHEDRKAGTSTGSSAVVSNVYTVTTGFDDGPGSLRDAIRQANSNPGHDVIVFDIPGGITVTLASPLEIIDPLSITGYITDTSPTPIDATPVVGAVFIMTNNTDSSINGLRILNASSGYGISATNAVTLTISDVSVENSMGGIQLASANVISMTNVGLFDIGGTGVEVKQSSDVHLGRLTLSNIGDTGVHVSDGVKDMDIISNTFAGIVEEFGAAIIVNGDPAPTGIQMRGNLFTDTFQPIFLGSGANNDFPAPEIAGATLLGVDELQLSFLSAANPVTHTHPLSIDLYRVRDGNYTPLGMAVTYDGVDFPNPITITTFVENLNETDFVSLLATTANPSTSQFSNAVMPTPPPPDSDADGVIDDEDQCPATTIPEPVPTVELRVNRFALVDGDLTFDTVSPKGKGPRRSYTTTETAGCSCEQIVDELGLGSGHEKFGCSISAMDSWVELVGGEAGKAYLTRSGPDETPATFALQQNYPNPFNPTTAITFELPEQGHVVLRVFDVMGRVVATLVDAELDQGAYRATWDGRNAHGQAVSSGLYIYRIEAGDYSAERSMSLLR